MADLELEKINALLEQHKDKNFVQRIISPEKYPNIHLPDQPVGMSSTHLMSWGTIGDSKNPEHIVYPQIIQDASGKLVKMSTKDAMRYAITTGQYIPFKDPNEADWFSQNYKKVWKKPEPKQEDKK